MEQQELEYLKSKYQVQFSPSQQYQVVITPKEEKINLIDTLYNSQTPQKKNLDQNYQYTEKSHYEEQKEQNVLSKNVPTLESLNASLHDVKKENVILKKITRDIQQDADKRKQELEELKQQYEDIQNQIKEEKLLHKTLDEQYYEEALRKSYLLTQFQD